MGFAQGADFFELSQAARVTAIRLQNVDDLGFEDCAHLPDGAVALAGGQGHGHRFPHPAHDLDVAGHPGFLQKQQVVRFELGGKLLDEGSRQLRVSVEHDGAVVTNLLACFVHGGDAGLDLGRGAGVVMGATRGADLDPLR